MPLTLEQPKGTEETVRVGEWPLTWGQRIFFALAFLVLLVILFFGESHL